MSALDPTPTLDGPARGSGFLSLLRRTRCVALMNGLRDAPLEHDDLIADVGFEGSAFDRPMRRLTDMGLIVRMAMPDDHRRKGYHLAHCGRDLLEIDAALKAAMAGFVVQKRISKTLLVKSISDPWDRAIIRVVLEASQQFSDLLRTAHGAWRPTGATHSAQLSAAALNRRLDRLRRLGLVARQSEAPLYEPGENLWRLARPAAQMARWRWRWTPESVPRMAGDLSGLVRMITLRVRLPQGTEIRVVLHVSAPPGMDDWPYVVVCVNDGRMSLPELTLPPSDARARATPHVWLEALLGGQFDAIEIEGKRTAAHTVLCGLAEVLGA